MFMFYFCFNPWDESFLNIWDMKNIESQWTRCLEFFNTDAFCQKTNLTSHHEIWTRERQFHELLFKRSLVGALKLEPELWTLMLTFNTTYGKCITGLHTHLNFCVKDIQYFHWNISCKVKLDIPMHIEHG